MESEDRLAGVKGSSSMAATFARLWKARLSLTLSSEWLPAAVSTGGLALLVSWASPTSS